MTVGELVEALSAHKGWLEREVVVIDDGSQNPGQLVVRDLEPRPTGLAGGAVVLWISEERRIIKINP